MRWSVEVTSIGKSDSESVQVDADTWQKALEITRSERGHGASMAGFSIELVEDGCRAVDPELRVRYSVRAVAPEPREPFAPVREPPRPAPAAPEPSPAAAREVAAAA